MAKNIASIIAMVYYGIMWIISFCMAYHTTDYIFSNFLKGYESPGTFVKMFMYILLTSICYKAIKSLFPSLVVNDEN
jgi:hypothetical protein